MSAILFIFYLACALQEDPPEQVQQDLKAFLDVFYADDLTYATISQEHRMKIKTDTPQKLINYGIHVNETKTEEGEAPDKRPLHHHLPHLMKILVIESYGKLRLVAPTKGVPQRPTYKDIKLLGTRLDTKTDIHTRKARVWESIKKFRQY